MDISTQELIELIENSSLTPGEKYIIIDYSDLKISTTAISQNEIDTEFVSEDGYYHCHYVLEDMNIDYMYDNDGNDGYYDYRDNISNCKNVSLSDSDVNVVDSENVFVGSGCKGSISESTNIIVGENNNVDITKSVYVSIGDNNNVTLNICGSVNIGNGNTLNLEDGNGLSIGDGNDDINVSGINILGGDNKHITITGDSNVVGYKNVDIVINGDCNEVVESGYSEIRGGFNDIKKSFLIKTVDAFGNSVNESDSIDIKETNNNSVMTRNLEIDRRDCLLSYVDFGGVRRVRNMVEKINLQSDSQARVLIIDEMKFRGESEVKSQKRYELVDGVWTEIEKD